MKCRRLTVALTSIALLCLSCGTNHEDGVLAADPSRQAERDRMVTDQIVARGITDSRVIAAMRRVPRHRFVPDSHARFAYADGPLPIGHGQTISQPFIVAFMTEALALQSREKVLEIGSGSGYQAAVLAELASRVLTIELVEPLARQAAGLLAELGYTNVTVRAGDGYRGWPEDAPFDAIIVTAATDHVPQSLLDQLAIGGRLILPLGDAFQRLTLYRRTKDGYERTELIPVRFVPLLRENRVSQADKP